MRLIPFIKIHLGKLTHFYAGTGDPLAAMLQKTSSLKLQT
jgi:hypothetical protein